MAQSESALEDESDGCAVVSDRMELIYLNELARALVPLDWFGRRCFEIFPTANELCAFNCPTRTAVHEAHEILYCEEDLRVDGRSRELGVAVVPLEGVSGDKRVLCWCCGPRTRAEQGRKPFSAKAAAC